jgi:hypothetical protein
VAHQTLFSRENQKGAARKYSWGTKNDLEFDRHPIIHLLVAKALAGHPRVK